MAQASFRLKAILSSAEMTAPAPHTLTHPHLGLFGGRFSDCGLYAHQTA